MFTFFVEVNRGVVAFRWPMEEHLLLFLLTLHIIRQSSRNNKVYIKFYRWFVLLLAFCFSTLHVA